MTSREAFAESIERLFPGISRNPIFWAAALTWHEVTHKLVGRAWQAKERSIVERPLSSAERQLGAEGTQQIKEWHQGLDQHDY